MWVFNGDQQADIAVSYSGANSIGVLLGYKNGIMGSVQKFPVGNKTYYTRITASDFNNDGCQDILATDDQSGAVFVLLNICQCQQPLE
ncbi:hypothetical protein I4U23_016928 [Adineta vaga]|nr:hypothetical protein I4U23_016928 [Adineta vaga]